MYTGIRLDCNSTFTSGEHMKEKLLHIYCGEGVRPGDHRRIETG
jgi:hypothetical protein